MCKWNQIRGSAIFIFLSCDHLSKPESLSSTKIAVNSTTSRGLRILMVAVSSIILHLVTALVIPLLAAWVLHGFFMLFSWLGGGGVCVFGELEIASELMAGQGWK